MQNTLILNQPIIRQISLKWKLNLRVFGVLISILIFLSLIAYVVQLNFLFFETNSIKNYDKKLDKITQENKNLEVSSAQMNSLGNIEAQIENKIQDLSFEKINNIYYIQVSDTTIAKVNKNNE